VLKWLAPDWAMLVYAAGIYLRPLIWDMPGAKIPKATDFVCLALASFAGSLVNPNGWRPHDSGAFRATGLRPALRRWLSNALNYGDRLPRIQRGCHGLALAIRHAADFAALEATGWQELYRDHTAVLLAASHDTH
jgi:hypothetical protein